MSKTNKFIIISACIFFAAAASILLAQKSSAPTKKIKDMDDRVVEVPVNPQRIACLHGVSNERIITLGKGSSLAMMGGGPADWIYKYYPELKNVMVVGAHSTTDIEKMLNLKVDLVIYSPNPGAAEKYREAGISTVCGFAEQKRPRNIEDFKNNFKRQYRFFGDLFDAETKARVDKYCAYFDAKINKILAITSKIKDKDKPTVYYGGRSGTFYSTQGRDSVLHWFVKIAGGNYLPAAIDKNYAEANMEQVLGWNPDIILLSGYAPNINLSKTPALASMSAVKNNKVHRIPRGFFMWELASGESVLFAIYIAKIFHPEQFKDWNMANEMKTFYSEIYKKNVSDEDINKILKALPSS